MRRPLVRVVSIGAAVELALELDGLRPQRRPLAEDDRGDAAGVRRGRAGAHRSVQALVTVLYTKSNTKQKLLASPVRSGIKQTSKTPAPIARDVTTGCRNVDRGTIVVGVAREVLEENVAWIHSPAHRRRSRDRHGASDVGGCHAQVCGGVTVQGAIAGRRDVRRTGSPSRCRSWRCVG